MTHKYLHERARAGEKVIAIESHRRDYTYRAFVDRRTGKLIRVTAGCRRWNDFKQAQDHYKGDIMEGQTYGNKWSPSLIDDQLVARFCVPGYVNIPGMFQSELFRQYLIRDEARAILRKLSRLVDRNARKRYRLNMTERTAKMRATRARNKRAAA